MSIRTLDRRWSHLGRRRRGQRGESWLKRLRRVDGLQDIKVGWRKREKSRTKLRKDGEGEKAGEDRKWKRGKTKER